MVDRQQRPDRHRNADQQQLGFGRDIAQFHDSLPFISRAVSS
jgi:hypothetical protein